MALLPVNPILVDTRTEALKAAPGGIGTRLTAMPEAEVRQLRQEVHL